MQSDKADTLIAKIVEAELAVENKKAELRQKYPDYEKEMSWVEKTEDEIKEAKEELTKYLADNQDFDTHKVSGHIVSVTRVVKLEVDDVEKVPDDLKEMKTDWQVDVKEAQNQIKMLGGTLPGFKDKSYYRLNFKKAK